MSIDTNHLAWLGWLDQTLFAVADHQRAIRPPVKSEDIRGQFLGVRHLWDSWGFFARQMV